MLRSIFMWVGVCVCIWVCPCSNKRMLSVKKKNQKLRHLSIFVAHSQRIFSALHLHQLGTSWAPAFNACCHFGFEKWAHQRNIIKATEMHASNGKMQGKTTTNKCNCSNNSSRMPRVSAENSTPQSARWAFAQLSWGLDDLNDFEYAPMQKVLNLCMQTYIYIFFLWNPQPSRLSAYVAAVAAAIVIFC